MMHEREKSDPAIGAGKPTNNAEATSVADAAEPVEQRAGAETHEPPQPHHGPCTGAQRRGLPTGHRSRPFRRGTCPEQVLSNENWGTRE